MFGFSMVQMVRNHSEKLDRKLRKDLLNLYRPFKWTPCFLHSTFENILKRYRKFSVIVEFHDSNCYSEGVTEAKSSARNHARSRMKYEYPAIDSCCMDLSPNGIQSLLDNNQHVKKIYFDHEVKALLDVSTPAIKSDQITYNQSEITGKDVTIAIIDTGIYPHEDLQDHSGSTIRNRIVAFQDFINQRIDPYDDNGHGTHCAGDAAGNGFASNGKYVGPAPDANLVGIKVLDKLGSGSLSTVAAGVQWCIDYNNDPNNITKIDIISMSLGGPNTEEEDAVEKMVKKAWNEHGIVVCVAAGNDGPNPGTIASPGVVPEIITVGAMDDKNSVPRADDSIASFSSTSTEDNPTKPDVVSPGTNIISLRSPNSYLDKLQKSNRVDEAYFSLSGTSMATPICAGACAQIIEYARHLNIALSPDTLKGKLEQGAEFRNEWIDNKKAYGSGYINVEETIKLLEN